MSTISDLPPSSKLLTGPSYAWQGFQDVSGREDSHTWEVKYSESNAFYQTVCGNVVTISYTGGSVTRRIPLQHPDNPQMYAKRIDWQGIDGIKKNPGDRYASVRIKVTFGYPGYSVTSDTSEGGQNSTNNYPPFMKFSGKASMRSITDTSKKYTYGTGAGTPLNQNVAVHFGGVSYSVQLFCIPDLAAWQAIMDPLKGCVNSTDLVLGAFSQPAGSVLLEGFTALSKISMSWEICDGLGVLS